MKSTNIGVVNLIISNKLKDAYFNDNLLGESKDLAVRFFDIVKNSPILELEFKVFNNIENKFVENELTASRYIDNNIKLFEIYTLSEIDKEHEKLNTFLIENVQLDSEKLDLYNAIETLIRESLTDYDKIDVDKIHESFVLVLNHVQTPKKQENNIINSELINEEIIEIAINKFNERYEALSEDEKTLLTRLVKADDKEKQNILEEYKNENLVILERLNKDRIEDKIVKTIQKIKEMPFNPQTVADDIISLHELKKGLL